MVWAEQVQCLGNVKEGYCYLDVAFFRPVRTLKRLKRLPLMGTSLVDVSKHRRIILELDSSTAAKALKSAQTDRSMLCHIYEETKTLLNKFQEYKIVTTKRESNQVADALAKLARINGDPDIVSDIPTQIGQLVMNDVYLFSRFNI
jgi:uncharacterized protein YcgL (UPF0745 family)